MSSEPLPDRDDLLERERQLADAEEEQARLQAENETLGGEPPAAASRQPLIPRAHAERAGYRALDPLIRVERRLHEAESAVADLAIENAILQNRRSDRTAARRLLFLRVAIALGLVGGDVLVTWVLLDSVALMAFTLVLAGLAVLLLWLIDTIKPTPGGQKGRFPPYGG